MTHDVRAVPSVNQDLVVGVGLPLYLLGAVGSWGLVFAEGRKTQKRVTQVSPTNQDNKVCLVQSAARGGGLPVGHGRGNVSVIESGVPRKQDDASVAKHTVEKQLRAQQQGEMG